LSDKRIGRPNPFGSHEARIEKGRLGHPARILMQSVSLQSAREQSLVLSPKATRKNP
jgi:hypothetical protein